jgi:hypothetical protein
VTSPLSQAPLVYDLDQALASLRVAARRYAGTYLPRDLLCAAVAFTVQLAIESGHNCEQLRELERELIAGIETAERDPLGGKIEPEVAP